MDIDYLKLYDKHMRHVETIRRNGKDLLAAAEELEMSTLRTLGITCANRDPGFPCWEIEGVQGYFNTSREAVVAKFKGK